jgi:hypothetical protein
MGGSIQEAADVLGDSEAIVRKHYAKWSAGRQARISDLPNRLWHVYDARDSSEKEIQKNDLWPYAAHAIQRANNFKRMNEMEWWTAWDSNPRPRRCERRALPAELAAHSQLVTITLYQNTPRQLRGRVYQGNA